MVDYEPKWNSRDSDMPSGMDSLTQNDWVHERNKLRRMVNGPDSDEQFPSGGGGGGNTVVALGQVAIGLAPLIRFLLRVLAYAFFMALSCALAIAAFLADRYLFLHGLSPWG